MVLSQRARREVVQGEVTRYAGLLAMMAPGVEAQGATVLCDTG